jgi:hypothetical protein
MRYQGVHHQVWVIGSLISGSALPGLGYWLSDIRKCITMFGLLAL